MRSLFCVDVEELRGCTLHIIQNYILNILSLSEPLSWVGTESIILLHSLLSYGSSVIMNYDRIYVAVSSVYIHFFLCAPNRRRLLTFGWIWRAHVVTHFYYYYCFRCMHLFLESYDECCRRFGYWPKPLTLNCNRSKDLTVELQIYSQIN